MQLVLHVGLPKTGTTTLQHHVFPAVTGLSYSTVYRNDAAGLAKNLVRLTRASQRDELRKVKQEHQRLLTQEQARALLISSEDFTFARKSDWQAVPGRLREVTGPAKIVLVLREQLSWIESYYFFHQRKNVRSGRLLLPQQFVERELALGDSGAFAVTDYRLLVDLWMSAFGSDSVAVVPYEWMLRRSLDFFRPFAEGLDRDPAEFADELAAAPRFNERLSVDRFYAGLHHTVLRRRFGFGYKLAQLLGFSLDAAPTFDPRPVRFDFAPLIPATVDVKWRDGNAAVAAATRIDLAELGYRV